MVEGDVMDGEITLAIVARPIPVHAVSATIVIAVAATETKALARKGGLKAAVEMSVVMEEVVHVETVLAVAAVRDDRTKGLATTRMAVAIRASGQKGPAQIATSDAGMLRVLPAATRVNVVRLAKAVPSRLLASNQMGAVIADPISTAATRHGPRRPFRRTILATGLRVPKRTATGLMVSAGNVAANVAAVVDADAVDAAAVAVVRAVVARVARWADRPRVGRRKVGRKTRSPRRPHRYRRLTVVTNRVGTKANTTGVVRVVASHIRASSRTSAKRSRRSPARLLRRPERRQASSGSRRSRGVSLHRSSGSPHLRNASRPHRSESRHVRNASRRLSSGSRRRSFASRSHRPSFARLPRRLSM